MRLHIHHEVGSGDGLFGSYQRDKEPITVTPAEISYQRRIASSTTTMIRFRCRFRTLQRSRRTRNQHAQDGRVVDGRQVEDTQGGVEPKFQGGRAVEQQKITYG